jgi:hypothetical protein
MMTSTDSRHRPRSVRLLAIITLPVIAVVLGASTHPARTPGAHAQQVPTFSRDIAPIIYKNCASCHRDGGMAPMALLSYEDALSSVTDIRDMVDRQEMPPWHADAPRGVFANDRRLSDADRESVLRWADGGAPQGNAADAPPLPVFASAWTIGTPDTIITMPTEYEVPAQGMIEYQYFTVPTGFTEEKWVQAIEILPGAREVVHHVLVYAREPGAAARPSVIRLRADQGLPPDAPRQDQTNAPRGALGGLIATTAPGTNAMRFPEGTALRIGPGTILTFQLHYTAHGHAMKDRSSLGLIFAKAPPVEEIRASYFVNGRFEIPPGASDHRVDSELRFSEPVHIWAIFPHTHLRGKKWEYHLVMPDSSSTTILSVPHYDFNWQTYYVFAQPLAIPAGARIAASAWYDNSNGNKDNPDPTIAVKWGEQTWEEMQYTGFLYSVDSRRRTGSRR